MILISLCPVQELAEKQPPIVVYPHGGWVSGLLCAKLADSPRPHGSDVRSHHATVAHTCIVHLVQRSFGDTVSRRSRGFAAVSRFFLIFQRVGRVFGCPSGVPRLHRLRPGLHRVSPPSRAGHSGGRWDARFAGCTPADGATRVSGADPACGIQPRRLHRSPCGGSLPGSLCRNGPDVSGHHHL